MEMLAGSPVLSRPGVDIGTHAGPEISLALCSCSLCPYSWDAASSAWVGGSALSPPITHPAYFLQATAMHSDCIFKKEQAMCLEKIQRANDLLGLNDSFPGEFVGMGQVRGLGRPSSPSTSIQAGHRVFPAFIQPACRRWCRGSSRSADGVLELPWLGVWSPAISRAVLGGQWG